MPIQVDPDTHRHLKRISLLTRHSIGELVALLTELYGQELAARLLRDISRQHV